MTKGVLGIIICPMNDDFLLHYLCKDPEVGRIVLLENDNSSRIGRRLSENGARFETVPEREFFEGRIAFDEDIFNIVIMTNSLGLHAEPQSLRTFIEDQILRMQPLIDAIGLYYGLCGNFAWDISKWAEQRGLKPVEVFRGKDGAVCDDCVSIAVGGPSRYWDLEKKYTGMFYLTPSIAENWEDFVAAGDGAKQLEAIPKETLDEIDVHSPTDMMRWMFELGGYQYILKLDTGLSDRKRFDEHAETIGGKLRLKPIDAEDGWVTLYPAESLYRKCKAHLA